MDRGREERPKETKICPKGEREETVSSERSCSHISSTLPQAKEIELNTRCFKRALNILQETESHRPPAVSLQHKEHTLFCLNPFLVLLVLYIFVPSFPNLTNDPRQFHFMFPICKIKITKFFKYLTILNFFKVIFKLCYLPICTEKKSLFFSMSSF